jgi:hypothetical protein
MGAAPIPGTTEAFNPIAGQWKKYQLNQIGNTNGWPWRLVISRMSNAHVEEAGGGLRFRRLHGEQEERVVQLHDRLDRRSARHATGATSRRRCTRRHSPEDGAKGPRWRAADLGRHCEERSDEAIQGP